MKAVESFHGLSFAVQSPGPPGMQSERKRDPINREVLFAWPQATRSLPSSALPGTPLRPRHRRPESGHHRYRDAAKHLRALPQRIFPHPPRGRRKPSPFSKNSAPRQWQSAHGTAELDFQAATQCLLVGIDPFGRGNRHWEIQDAASVAYWESRGERIFVKICTLTPFPLTPFPRDPIPTASRSGGTA